jgi:transposase
LRALDTTNWNNEDQTVRVTTLLNKLINLQGLRVAWVRFEDGVMILRVHRTFRLLTCPRCGRQKCGRESARVRRWRHMSIWGMEVWIEGEIRRL